MIAEGYHASLAWRVLDHPHTKGGRFPMSRSAFAVPAIVLFASVVMWGAAKPPPPEQRVHGTVVAATAGYCEPKKEQGCTGTLTLDSRSERRTIRIPLGTPISAGCEPLAFGELPGHHVVVTEVEAPSGPVAKAVSALDAPAGPAC
jgi:hypothetical protein